MALAAMVAAFLAMPALSQDASIPPPTVSTPGTRTDPSLGIPDIDFSLDGETTTAPAERQPAAPPPPAPTRPERTTTQPSPAPQTTGRAAPSEPSNAPAAPASTSEPDRSEQTALPEMTPGDAVPADLDPQPGETAPLAQAAPGSPDPVPVRGSGGWLGWIALALALLALGWWFVTRRREAGKEPYEEGAGQEVLAAEPAERPDPLATPQPETKPEPILANAAEESVASQQSAASAGGITIPIRSLADRMASLTDAPQEPAKAPVAPDRQAEPTQRSTARKIPVPPASSTSGGARFDAFGMPVAPRAPARQASPAPAAPKRRIQRFDALGLPIPD